MSNFALRKKFSKQSLKQNLKLCFEKKVLKAKFEKQIEKKSSQSKV